METTNDTRGVPYSPDGAACGRCLGDGFAHHPNCERGVQAQHDAARSTSRKGLRPGRMFADDLPASRQHDADYYDAQAKAQAAGAAPEPTRLCTCEYEEISIEFDSDKCGNCGKILSCAVCAGATGAGDLMVVDFVKPSGALVLAHAECAVTPSTRPGDPQRWTRA